VLLELRVIVSTQSRLPGLFKIPSITLKGWSFRASSKLQTLDVGIEFGEAPGSLGRACQL
jgi:hypothetical protein